MTRLAARRLADMVELGERVAATELVIAARAANLRSPGQLGAGTSHAYDAIQAALQPADGGPVPVDIESVRELIRSGAIIVHRLRWGGDRRSGHATTVAGAQHLVLADCDTGDAVTCEVLYVGKPGPRPRGIPIPVVMSRSPASRHFHGRGTSIESAQALYGARSRRTSAW